MTKCSREPYRGHYVDFTLYILMTLCIVLLTCSLFKLNGKLKSVNEELKQLELRVAELSAVEEKEPPVEDIDIIEVIEKPIEDPAKYDKEAEWPRLYTDEDAAVLAKMLWGEARGVGVLEVGGTYVSGECQQAAVIWTALNRYDAGYGSSITAVVTAPKQFRGYRESNPVDDELLGLVIDVLDRWNREKHGETHVGRVIPSDYMWFGGDGDYNYFRNEYYGKTNWDWSLEDIYE